SIRGDLMNVMRGWFKPRIAAGAIQIKPQSCHGEIENLRDRHSVGIICLLIGNMCFRSEGITSPIEQIKTRSVIPVPERSKGTRDPRTQTVPGGPRSGFLGPGSRCARPG